MSSICERAQGNLWGLYREYLWEPNDMENILVICEKYLCGLKIVYGIVWVFFSEWAKEIRVRKFVPQHSQHVPLILRGML